MKYKLGTNVQIGNKILTETKWEKIIEKTERGIVTKDGTQIKFGEEIYGWKIK